MRMVLAPIVDRMLSATEARRNLQLEEGVGNLQHEDVGVIVLMAD